jgi:hypothetical protein
MNKHGLKYEGGDLVKLQVGYLKKRKNKPISETIFQQKAQM